MRQLTAFEHGWLEVGPTGHLTAAEADALAASEQHLPGGCLQWGHRRVKFAQFCGVVRVEGLQIEILPKLHPHQAEAQQRSTMVNMLACVGDLDGMETIAANLATNRTTLLDLFIRHFAQLLERQLQQGMMRDYRDIEETLGQVRGRIDVLLQQRENLFKPQRIACRFSELIADIPVNRLLHSTIQLVCSLATSPILKQRLRSLRTRFAGVQPLAPHERGPRSSDLNRMQRRYAGIVDLAHLFLDGQFLDPRSGQHRAFSLLFDMNRLFERYTASLLRPIARRQGLRLVEQGPRRYLGHDETGRGRLLMRPDIALLDPDGRPIIIVDTKWKRLEGNDPMAGLSPADLYQMASYANAYRCASVCLLYPAQSTLPAGQSHRLQLNLANIARLTLQSVGFEQDFSFLCPLQDLIEPSRRDPGRFADSTADPTPIRVPAARAAR
ncbi:MAG: hypothetical protein EA370_16455 [Wenzhouxiangella sp.]|nr:MAG: hypothetical protein EA370_16455 [Wenzhouxiangella sp.]